MLKTLSVSALYEPKQDAELDAIVEAVLGLVGRSGDVSDLVKKWLRDGGSLPRDALAVELTGLREHLVVLAKIAEIDWAQVSSRPPADSDKQL